ncbi:MAG: Hsp20/alpha crystallin family protein [Treponema sp.]|nr:Hsp20/alpha crystallin family protein [Treponema sp.]
MNDLINSIFNDLWVSPTACVKTYPYSAPKVDVKENKDSYTLEMDLPGRSEDDIEIELNKDNLTIASKEEKKAENKEEKYILRERNYSDFNRRFTLPEDVDTDSIKANFKNGVLIINMNKKEIEKPKSIKIIAG